MERLYSINNSYYSYIFDMNNMNTVCMLSQITVVPIFSLIDGVILINKGYHNFQNNSPDKTTMPNNKLSVIANEIKSPLLSIDCYIQKFMEIYASSLDMEGLELLLTVRSICMDTINSITKVMEYGSKVCSYPLGKEKEIIIYFKNKDLSLISYFENILEHLYQSLNNDIIKADIVSRQLYQTIILEVYQEYTWLDNYLHPSFFDKMDYYIDGDIWAFKKFYIRKVTYLIEFIISFSLTVKDTAVNEILRYILFNPDKDLRLKILAPLFFTNNTYLSNTFYTKTGLHYNEYIAKIKMARAGYLFQYTDLKIYQVSYQLGYKDINYFSRQFKKHYGLNPTEFRNNNFSDYQI